MSADELREMRHELRTPLNLIVGYCEMLLEDTGDAGRRAPLDETLRAARTVLDLVNTTLASGHSGVGSDTITALHESMREPYRRMMDSTQTLLELAAVASDAQFEADVKRVRNAVERLYAVAQPVPRARTATPVPIAAAAPAATASAGFRHATGARILVVDDLEDNRSVLERRLSRQGHVVTCASGGVEALDRAGRERFDLVLLDVMMPDLDGHAVLERLKSSPATRDIPVIMISALDDEATVVRCIEHGAEDHLPKPFDPVLLRARIDACLEKKRLRDVELEYLEQVRAVIAAARDVESGTYEAGTLGPLTRRGDELGLLARVFESMVAQVRAREDRLRTHIAELRREIAEARRPLPATPGSRRQHALPIGDVFAGRYDILEETGSGGMGIVYRAFDRELAEPVAIKTLHPELVTDAEALERFRSEIRLARHISHRNVVRIHDIGEAAGIYYLTMEYVEGITVRALLDTRGRLGVAATLAIAGQLARSLIVAHEQGVIHRDIKPANLLLDADGTLKVMDFGVARLAERTTEITSAGMVVGTPAYMSPEQLLSEPLDGRSDLYSAGVVLYECLTGRLPFEASSPFILVARVLKEQAQSPRIDNPEVSPALGDLILRLLAKDRAARPADAEELAHLLSDIA